MKIDRLKRIIAECMRESVNEVEPESPTGMSAVNVAEQTGQYTELVKVPDYMDPEPLNIVRMKGPSAAIDYLVAQIKNYQPKQLTEPPWKSTDKTFDRGDYVLYWSDSEKYVGLVQVGESLKEMTTTSGGGGSSAGTPGYMTPHAFSKRKYSEKAYKGSESLGYTKVDNKKKNTK
jgi:hypothetical protein